MPISRTSEGQQRHLLLEILQELYFHTVSPEERDDLLRRLYETNLRTLEECLLQVTHVCITHPDAALQEQLEGFMLWLAGRSLSIALRLSWTVDAISNYCRSTGLGDRVQHIQDKLESYAINQGQAVHLTSNGNINDNSTADLNSAANVTTPASPSINSGDGLGNEIDATVVPRKEARLMMYNDQRRFVTGLTDMSSLLRFFPNRSRRKDELRKRLETLNGRLDQMRVMHPLGRSGDPVQWIVRIAVEECTVFSSRERAPYLIRYEVIVDSTATMNDPTVSTLRCHDGSFRVAAGSDELFAATTPGTAAAAAHSSSVDARSSPTPPASGTGLSDDSIDFLQLAFGESKEHRLRRVRESSPWGSHPNWSMNSMIVKAGDDLRQEEFALQLLYVFNKIWEDAGLSCCVRPYVTISTGADCGLLEVVEESSSMDGIKKACSVSSIYNFFTKAFDGESSVAYRRAQQNFVETMAGYSIASYILQVKDRHNGNLMISRDGHLVHIDFGFLLATSPGGLNFESAPFKLSQELIDVMGGTNSDAFNYYRILVYQALSAARERSSDILSLVSIMTPFNAMPCFGADPTLVMGQVRSRFRNDLVSEADYAVYAKELVNNSADNWRTRRYDQFQTLQNGIV